ncbi:pol poly [Schistosoma japonicum]|uniref:Pol poly n=1 Tax=Schistosoma japonicum TaxID=6182 RepID=A0A4Z2CNR5_SCHJA|nr:pol poly [Schistosoma japonicum]
MNEPVFKALEQLKGILGSASLLFNWDNNLPPDIMTYASNTTVKSVLQQYVNGQYEPLLFFYKRRDDTQARYSTSSRKLLTSYLAIK